MINLSKKNIFQKACLALLLGMLFTTSACVRHSEMQTEGADFLQGVWVQDSIPHQAQMMDYTLHEFKFTCDSIYTVMKVHAKTQRIPDSCYKDGNWTEYAKGVYVMRGDSLIGEGIYTKPNGKYKASGCYKTGTYLPRYRVAYHSKDSLVLESRYDQRPLVLRKTQDITCVPKRRWED
ncbi:fumarate hydratase [Sphingobacterium psychroaquaticum]|uniref:fumarate hydratase n=1 Tax=Sphingobacterium psychroaquaticum TaxID=561061 RepID=UPI00106BB0CB|nr:fumarate hydratase [Sphingobacterium psychroaquaticum]QBQ42816.1 fumarate hydratase [Sphingobacterium psychroaquaticum]